VNSTDRLRISLLGKLAASHDGEVLDLGGRRQRAVLALLLLARGEVVLAERLAESLWGDRAPANAAGVLQSYVSHLRRRLQPGTAARARSAVIVSEGRGYAVRLPPEAVDAWRFEALLQQAGAGADPREPAALLGEALALWHGPALADYADEPWAEPEIVRLNELRSVAREQLLAARLQLGESALLVPELEAMVAEEPLREERWRLLVLALYRARRQADALGALRRARTMLADELGIDPGPGLRELEGEVLAQSPSLDAPRRPPVAPTPITPPVTPPFTPPVTVAATDFADRDKEVAAVHAALDDLAAGEPRLLLIEGPAGIGKTRLLAEARRLAAARLVRVLTARGSQLERAFGFGVARQLFEPELTAPDRREELLGGAASSARSVFDLVEGDQAEGSFAVLHGLYWLAANVAESGPLVLAVDDVQWCDKASLRYLAFLVRRLEAVPVLVVGTVRTGEDDAHDGLLAELALEPAAVVLRPAPLSAEATAGIVAGRLGAPVSPLFTAACHRTTAGNPLLLRQLLRGLEADGVRPDAAHADKVVAVGSRAVSSMVLMRLRRLARDVTAVARAAAVLGDGAPLPAVAALAEVAEPDTAAALAVLARAEVVKDEQPLAFAHPLVREAVYRDLSAAQRELWHERAVHVLRGCGASDEQLGAHLLLAPRRAKPATVSVLRGAARTAAARGASDSAVTYLRRALAEPPASADRCEVLLELGLLESLLDGPASAEHLQDAYELLDGGARRAEIAIAIARTQVFASPPGVATAFAREAACAVPADLTDHRQALRAIERISGFMHGLDVGTWRTTPAPEPSGDGTGAQMLASALAWEAVMDGTDRDRAVTLARFALDGDRLWAVDNGLFWVVAAVVRMLADDDLGDFWHRARAQAHQRGSLFAVMSTSMWQGFWHWRRGELDEALACEVAALDQDRMWGGIGIGEPYGRSVEISCHLDRGDLAAARRAADAALTGPAAGEGARVLRQDIARLLVAEGRHADALATLEARPTPIPVANPARNPWRSITAGALHGLGRTPEALALVADEVALLRRWGAPSYLGAGLRQQGELLGNGGVDLLREAVAVLTPSHAVVELARARCALGSSRAVADSEAVPLLLAASEAADAVGALGLRDRARAALRERGRPTDSRPEHVKRLSVTERRILDLAAEGVAVREVAQQLFLTPATVRAVLEASPEHPS
jgi:DNA-binding SARP family transcriptional activator/tetratricopeptide (TPR) repeat protein